MNYPEVLIERYNEVMFDERDIIEKFLKDQYDIRYGRQRDTWHFEPAVEVVAYQGSLVQIHDIKLDKDKSVVFYVEAFCEKNAEWECFDFAYGELSKVIEALPDANQLLIKNAVSDIASLCGECSVNLEEYPFKTNINGKFVSVALVDYIDGRVVAYNHDGKVVADEYASDFIVGLRNHINIEVLHRSNEYKELMELLSLEENMRFECQNYGDATFVIDGTDVTFDVSSVRRNDNGGLVIYGNDIDADVCDNIELTDKDIKREYLVGIINEMKRSKWEEILKDDLHEPELVRKINEAWNDEKYHELFEPILFAIVLRERKLYEHEFDTVVEMSTGWAMRNAHNILSACAYNSDLKAILLFIGYED